MTDILFLRNLVSLRRARAQDLSDAAHHPTLKRGTKEDRRGLAAAEARLAMLLISPARTPQLARSAAMLRTLRRKN